MDQRLIFLCEMAKYVKHRVYEHINISSLEFWHCTTIFFQSFLVLFVHSIKKKLENNRCTFQTSQFWQKLRKQHILFPLWWEKLRKCDNHSYLVPALWSSLQQALLFVCFEPERHINNTVSIFIQLWTLYCWNSRWVESTVFDYRVKHTKYLLVQASSD